MKITVFSAAWCGPCQQLKPQIQALAAKRGWAVEVVDIDERPDLASAHGVRSLPSVFVDGSRLLHTSPAKIMSELEAL